MAKVSAPADTLTGLVGFAAALRAAGLPCEPDRVRAYLAAVGHLDVAEPAHLYWAGRLTLCAEPDQLPRYDEAFAAWFTAKRPREQSRHENKRIEQRRIAALVPPGGQPAEAGEADRLKAAASETEILRRADIGKLTAAQREHLRALIALLRPDPPQRRALRWSRDRGGSLDPDRTLRAMLAAGGEPIRLARRRKGTRARRVVLLIDVSGSMTPYADALLRFGHAVARRSPACTEVFTLGTRMTRVTRQLRQRDPEVALAAAGNAVADFAGGTRLGETLRAFLDRWGQRGVARQAIVVLFSDGWERGDPSLLAEQTARLHRLAHKVFWVNPHAGRNGYAPIQAGIVAALPNIDRLLAGHSLATLDELLTEVRHA